EVNFDPIKKTDLTDKPNHPVFVASKNFDITLSHCSGSTVKMVVNSSHDSTSYFFADLDTNGLFYDIQILNPGTTITGGEKYFNSMVYDFSGNKPFIITPDSDSYTFTSKVDLNTLRPNPDSIPDTVSGSFTYNVTYM
ncbi:hypothetical protein AIT68_005001, partial [Salmonella enterica subsp. salamae]